MTTVHEPFVPEITAGDLSQPLRCLDCGAELELRCAEGHKHTANVGARPRRNATNPGRQECVCGHTRKQHDLDVVCMVVECPCTGFESKPKPVRGTMAARVYRPKVCSCGAPFTPKGPNTKRCEKCRNGGVLA